VWFLLLDANLKESALAGVTKRYFHSPGSGIEYEGSVRNTLRGVRQARIQVLADAIRMVLVVL
jgi:hypothetical protein